MFKKNLLITLVVAGVLLTFFSFLPQPPSQVDGSLGTEPPTARQQAEQNFVLGPVQLFDGERWQGRRYVEVRNGRISALSPEPIDNQLPKIDGGDQLLLPGLIDAHVHIWGDALQLMPVFGVTTAIDMFSSQAFLRELQQGREQTAWQPRADMYSAGTLVTIAKGHGTEYGMPIPTLQSAAQAEAFVRDRIAEGSDFIKIVYQSAKAPRRRQPSIDLASLQAVIAASRQQGKLAVVHIADQQSALEAVRAGAHGLVHGFMESQIQPALLAELVQRQVFVIPTLAVHEAMTVRQHSNKYVLDPLKHQTQASTPAQPGFLLNAQQRHGLDQGFTQFNIPPELFAQLLDNTRKMHQAGVRLLAGTDSPNPGTAHGVSLPLEMLLLLSAGLPLDQVLASATSIPADVFGLTQVGRVKVGYKADLVLLGDISQQPELLLQPHKVWKNGYLFSAPTSLAPVTLNAGLLADFNKSAKVNQGLGFSASSDSMMHGQSKATLNWQPEGYQSTGSIRLEGDIQPGFMFPWAGAAYLPGLSMEHGADFSRFSHLSFAARGTPGRYQLQVFAQGSMMPELLNFTLTANWQQFTLSLTELPPDSLAAVSMLLWSADPSSIKGKFQLELDQISAR